MWVKIKYPTRWVCPRCGYERKYRDEPEMKCLCGEWMEEAEDE